VVDCTREQQIERLMRRNNLTREAAIERIDAQPPQTEKRARADRIIDNSGAPDDTVAAVRALWETVRERIQRPA
jgi:dephospho-CoA kinase